MIIWLATGNEHKRTELAAILGGGYELHIPSDAGLDFDPAETGDSFHENALLKARELYRLLSGRRPPLFNPGDPVIADDSGLCVDALDGRPGIYSARYAGPPGVSGCAVDGKKLESAERNALLLAEIGGNPRRSARFVCAMALLFSPERFFLVQETVEGEIIRDSENAKGSGGFGYDPVFVVSGLGRTMAELSDTGKNRVSHRGKAGRVVAELLESHCRN